MKHIYTAEFFSIEVDSNESFLHGGKTPILTAASTGHAMHVFINGKLAGKSSNLIVLDFYASVYAFRDLSSCF